MEKKSPIITDPQLIEYASKLEQLHSGKEFHAKQQEVFRAMFRQDGKAKKRIFIRKGRKGGGTHTVLYPLARIAGLFPNRACYLIGPTAKLQSEIVWDNNRLQNFIPHSWGVRYNATSKRAVFPNKSFIKVEGANDPEALRGIEGDIFVWDEFKDHNIKSYEYCYPNIASRDAIWIVLGSPPTNKDSHYYKLEQQIKDDPDWFFIHWSSWDNTFLPGGRAWLEKERDKYYKKGDWDLWEVEWEARYVFNARSKVIPQFNSEKHVVPYDVIDAKIHLDKEHLRWLTIIDPGYATCFAVMFAVYNPYSSEFFVLDEIYSTERDKNSVHQLWPQIEAKQQQIYKGRWRNIYDSAALGFANEVKARWGKHIPMVPTIKGKDDEDNYFRLINSLFATDRTLISDRCVKTIWEIENYETEENGDYPDENNHELDNFRYALKSVNYRMLEDGAGPPEPPPSLPTTIHEGMREKKRQNDWGQAIMDAEFDIFGNDIEFH